MIKFEGARIVRISPGAPFWEWGLCMRQVTGYWNPKLSKARRWKISSAGDCRLRFVYPQRNPVLLCHIQLISDEGFHLRSREATRAEF